MMDQFEYQIKTDKTYAEQRAARLQDVIDDYLNWDDSNPRQMYDELLSSVDEIIAYHSLHLRCLLYTSPSPRDATLSRMPSSA